MADLVGSDDLDDRVEIVRQLFAHYLGRRPEIDADVWASERATGDRNRAIAYLMASRSILRHEMEQKLDLYFAQCSVLCVPRDLLGPPATLAHDGVHRQTGARVVDERVVRDMLTVALTCGMCDYAGEWAFSVGIPAKSGVGGGIVGILPGTGGIAAFSPRLDPHGHSVWGVRAFEELSKRFDLHLFDPARPWTRTSRPGGA